MAITNGLVANADEVKKQQAISLANTAQLMLNTSYVGYDASLNGYSGVPDWYNVILKNLDSNFAGTTVGTPSLCVNNVKMFGLYNFLFAGNVYDFMEGTSVDTDKWEDVGTPEVGTLSQVDNAYVQDYLQNATPSADITLSSKALDLKGSTGDGECIVKIYAKTLFQSGSSSSSFGAVYFYLRDEDGNQVTLDTDTASHGGGTSATVTMTKTYRLVFTTDNVAVYDISSGWPGTAVDATISTASLTGTEWHLRVRADSYGGDAANAESTCRIYPIVYANGVTDMGTNDYETNATTVDTTNSAFITYTGTDTGASALVSANGGSNYDSITKNDFALITNAGSSFKNKFRFTGSGTELPKVFEHVTFYDPW